MSFVDVIYDRHKNVVKVVERVNGERVFREEQFEHVLYYEHPAGSHKSIFDNACKKFVTTDPKKFRKQQMILKDKNTKVFESDIRETFRHLSKHYTGATAPQLHLCFFDIEVDFDPDRGWAPTDDPFCPVTAVTLHLSQLDRMVTLALVPPTITSEEAHEMCDPVYEDGVLVKGFEDTFLFEDEADLLATFLKLIDDSDVLSGWNSEGYDIPYLVNRIRRILGEDALKKFCLWGMKPREREYLKFGKTNKTYDLVGRVHLDYLVLYQKHVTQQQQSYKLDYIGEMEVGENKTVYEGTLDDLYKKDFYRFIEYNRQDVAILVKLDQKKKYIELHNQIAHANCVDLKTTVGSVALVEMAIINEMHAMGFVVPNRKPRPEEVVHPDDEDEEGRTPVVGAYVAKPKTGIHYEVACVDINSLYPSAIRSINMSPETILGQVRPDETQALVDTRIQNGTPRAEAWEDLFSSMEVWHMLTEGSVTHTFPDTIKTIPAEYRHYGWTVENDRLTATLSSDTMVTVDFEDGRSVQCTASDLRDYIFNPDNNVCISANGTIFRTDKEGIIPQLLAKWYADRKSMQAREKAFAKAAEEGVAVDDELARLLS
jgi:DNA polymerase elongation subunit (family B)